MTSAREKSDVRAAANERTNAKSTRMRCGLLQRASDWRATTEGKSSVYMSVRCFCQFNLAYLAGSAGRWGERNRLCLSSVFVVGAGLVGATIFAGPVSQWLREAGVCVLPPSLVFFILIRSFFYVF